ncbi:MAG: hypothetical protein RBT57_11240 [Paludibacter sp.]|nr:hypothetical protein [Paludibacter sp.]
MKIFFNIRLMISLFLSFLLSAVLNAQVSMSVAGQTVTGNGGSVSYTVGQVFYTTSSGTGGAIFNGVQHPVEILMVSDLNTTEIESVICAFPSTVRDQVVIKSTHSDQTTELTYQLCDTKGVVIMTGKIQGTHHIVSLHSLVPANYFLMILTSKAGIRNQLLNVFKLIKE